VSRVLRHTPSARCAIAANNVCRFLDIISENSVSVEDTFLVRETVQIPCVYF
jgi:hypothetical protein